jgi:hypothetical protein
VFLAKLLRGGGEGLNWMKSRFNSSRGACGGAKEHGVGVFLVI